MNFKWKKLGRVFDPATSDFKRNWIKEYAQAPATLIFDDFVRVFFSCRPGPDENGQYVSYTGYLDLDRSNLFNILRVSDEPILKLGELGTFDEFGTYPVSVIKHSDVFRAYYAGWSRCDSVPYNTAIGIAESEDAKIFKKLGKGPILSYSLKEPMTISGPKIRYFEGKYYLFYVAGERWIKGVNKPESVFKIKLAISDDGINWSKVNRNLIEHKLDENECQASPDVIFFKGKYHMFFSYKHAFDFRDNDRGYRIGYACSDNLYDWERHDENAGIEISKHPAFDDQSMAYPHVFELDGKVFMLYLGNSVGKNGFGLAELINYSL